MKAKSSVVQMSDLFTGILKGRVAKGGFTLLEVMIAVSIIAIAFASLFGSQSRSLSYATETLFNTKAPMLAALKLAELKAGVISTADSGGDFGEDFPGYQWEMSSESGGLGDVDFLGELSASIQKISLSVTWGGTNYSYSIVYYGEVGE